MAIFKRTALSFAVLLSLAPAFAQGNPSPRPIQAVRAGATRMDLSTYRSYYTNTGFNAFAVEWDFQTRGEAGSFSAAYNYPIFGIGFAYNTLNDVIFKSGKGHYDGLASLYGTMSRTLLRLGPVLAGYDLVLGISYTGAYFDPDSNKSNWFISAPVLFYSGAGGHLTWQLGRRLDLQADFSFRHNSSARFSYPNGGLNYWGAGLSARYYFQDRERSGGLHVRTPAVSQDRYEKGWNFELYAGGGVHACAADWLAYRTANKKSLPSKELTLWPMASINFDALYRLSGRFAIGATANAFYTSNSERLQWADNILYGEEAVAESAGYSPFSFGIGAVQEIFYSQFAFYLQEGFYLYKRAGIHADHGHIYERAGIRWYPRRLGPFFFGVCIKAHRAKADYMDFSVGIRLP